MLLSHAVLLAEARSYVAALADRTSSFDASMEYERVLLQLDWLHGGTVLPITVVPANNPIVVYNVACSAVGGLADHGVLRLELEICLAMLGAARELGVEGLAAPSESDVAVPLNGPAQCRSLGDGCRLGDGVTAGAAEPLLYPMVLQKGSELLADDASVLAVGHDETSSAHTPTRTRSPPRGVHQSTAYATD